MRHNKSNARQYATGLMLVRMASEAQRAANRANAKKSTGPRTPAGKAQSRLNATKHGILTREVLITAGEAQEDEAALAALRDDMCADLKPRGALEEFLVDHLVALMWRWRRVLRFETGATREVADEAVADWSRHQREKQAQLDRLDRLLTPQIPKTGKTAKKKRAPLVPEQRWEDTEDLEGNLRDARQAIGAFALDDPLAQPDRRLAWALYDVAKDEGLDMREALGVDDAIDVFEAIEHASREQLERLFGTILHAGESPQSGWIRLRAWAKCREWLAERELAYRTRQEDRLRMTSGLPLGSLEIVVRYESHLSREFDRTLRQLNERQASALSHSAKRTQSERSAPR